MENNPSKKKFRGFKYIILVLLVIAAIGFAYVSRDGWQSEDRTAGMKETASSVVADAKEQGKNLMDKAGELKEGLGETLAKGRDKVSDVVSDVGDKTGKMVQSASDAGSDMVERAKSATEDAGSGLTDKAKSALGMGQETQMENDVPSDDLSEQASGSVSDWQPKVNTMMEESSKSIMPESTGSVMDQASRSMKDDSSDAMMSQASEPEIGAEATNLPAGATTTQMTDDSDEVAGMIKEHMSGKQASDMTPSSSDMSDKRMASQPSADTSAETMAQKDDPAESSLRCIGPPPKGEDLGDQYIVAVCETLSIISERTGVGINDLKSRNPQVDNPDLIFPKQRLWLPPRG